MPDIYKVKVTRQAQEQMAEIVDYISHKLCAPEAAYNLLDKLENCIVSLAEYPERFQMIDEEPWRTKGIRKRVVENFIIYYWIDISGKKVQVIAVIYVGRDQIEQLRYMDLKD